MKAVYFIIGFWLFILGLFLSMNFQFEPAVNQKKHTQHGENEPKYQIQIHQQPVHLYFQPRSFKDEYYELTNNS